MSVTIRLTSAAPAQKPIGVPNMIVSATLTAEEFKDIHNALWELNCVTEQLQETLNSEIYEKLLKVQNQIRKALANSYDRDSKEFDRRGEHYSSVKKDLGVHDSQWSFYEIEDLNQRHPYEGAKVVSYKDPWDRWVGPPVEVPINGLTWAALWVAANAAIRESGDRHHVYIESFEVSKDDPSVLMLHTGS